MKTSMKMIGAGCLAGASLTIGVHAQFEAPLIEFPEIQLSAQAAFRTITIVIPSMRPDLGFSLSPIEDTPDFRPPSFFSAPLPVGSGARALGFSGTFTAIADDATAASWNPAGLAQLEHPEASAVYRFSHTRLNHHSSPEFNAADESYSSSRINYLSVGYPLFMKPFERNLVLSLNVQEAYDFKQSFRATQRDPVQTQVHKSSTGITNAITHTAPLVFAPGLTGHSTLSFFGTIHNTLEQTVTSKTVSDLTFDQEGTIDAVSPAWAFDLLPTLSVGAAVNVYRDGYGPHGSIHSRSLAHFISTNTSVSRITIRRDIQPTYESTLVSVRPAYPPYYPGETNSVTETGTYPRIQDHRTVTTVDRFVVDGTVLQEERFENLFGVNTTLGFIWTLSKDLSVAMSVDLPWAAEADQTITTTRETSIYNEARTRLLDFESTTSTVEKEVEFEFPLFWRSGLVWRWAPSWYTSLDVGWTQWSEFAFEVKGEGKKNPFDGSVHGVNPIDDTWTVSLGSEYLWVLKAVEIPFRVGCVWEQRPAIGQPDDYYGFSVGSGFVFGGKDPRLSIDVAYSYLTAKRVQSVVPEEDSLSTDAESHQVFISGILYF